MSEIPDSRPESSNPGDGDGEAPSPAIAVAVYPENAAPGEAEAEDQYEAANNFLAPPVAVDRPDSKERDEFEPRTLYNGAFSSERQSKFAIQPHNVSLITAFIYVISGLAFLLLNLLCIAYYYRNDFVNSAGLIIILHGLKAFIQTLFGVQRSVSSLPLPAVILLSFFGSLTHISLLVDFYEYFCQWRLHRFRGWNSATQAFGFHFTFATLPISFPVLIIQVYVIVYNNINSHSGPKRFSSYSPSNSYSNPVVYYEASVLELIAIAVSILQCFLSLAHYFQYIAIHSGVYTTLLIQSSINVLCRIVLICVVFNYIVDYSSAWLLMLLCGGISFLLGFAFYWVGVWSSVTSDRDDPRIDFQRRAKDGFTPGSSVSPKSASAAALRDRSWYLDHFLFGFFIVAPHLLFFSFPFAPNHSLFDWWHHYILHEWKIQCENVLMSSWILYKFYMANSDSLDNPQQSFYSLLGLIGIVLLCNLIFTWLLNHHMEVHIRIHGVSSENWIVTFWAVRWQRFAFSKPALAGRPVTSFAPAPGLAAPIQHRMSVLLTDYYSQPGDENIGQELIRMDSLAQTSAALMARQQANQPESRPMTEESELPARDQQQANQPESASPLKVSASPARPQPAFDPAGQANFASPAVATPTKPTQPANPPSAVNLLPPIPSSALPNLPVSDSAAQPRLIASPNLRSQYAELENEWQRQLEERKQMKSLLGSPSKTKPALAPVALPVSMPAPAQIKLAIEVSPKKVERANDE